MNPGLEAAQLKREELKRAGIQPERLDPIERAKRNPTSLRLAINAECFRCVGQGDDANPARLIRECEVKTCGLWNVRPHQKERSA